MVRLAAVHGDEALVAPRTGGMDGTRQQLLARAVLTDENHRRGDRGGDGRRRETMLARQSPLACEKDEAAMARFTWPSSSSRSTGFTRKPKAPDCVARTASGMVPCAVRMMTVICGQRVFSSLSSAKPSMVCRLRS